MRISNVWCGGANNPLMYSFCIYTFCFILHVMNVYTQVSNLLSGQGVEQGTKTRSIIKVGDMDATSPVWWT